MSHLLMVYGTLKQGHYNHRVMGDAKFIAAGSAHGFVLRDLGAFPCVTKGTGAVVGELYELTDEQFKNCDRLEGYPHMYNREQIKFYTFEEQNESVKDPYQMVYENVWIYTMHGSNAPIIESGIWTRRV